MTNPDNPDADVMTIRILVPGTPGTRTDAAEPEGTIADWSACEWRKLPADVSSNDRITHIQLWKPVRSSFAPGEMAYRDGQWVVPDQGDAP